MGLFKSKRKETEEELYARLLATDPKDPGYENLTKAAAAVGNTNADRKGTIAAAGIAGGLTLAGIIIENLFIGKRHKDAYKNEDKIVTTDAGKQSVRDGLRRR